ncbi:MAG TPA: leucyl/phenylalanyl-tRNA--protein transferase, partial [Aquabacterium sp.]|nr:leucyl/phenylalanyl-tRNA--protein transferase [Aquabacterium sp.]
TPFPSTAYALGPESEAPGLLAASQDLKLERLQQAYRAGIFPWFSPGQPVLWWSTNPRMVLPTAELKVSRSLRKTLRKFSEDPSCEIRIDHAFEAVIQACAQTEREGQKGTWIVKDVQRAYLQWHALGAVHSFETWREGKLVGGLYGVNLGRMFFGESMFSWESDASKIALAALVCFCRANQIDLIDCQQETRHLASMGARPWPREQFEAHLRGVVDLPPPKNWSYDRSLWRYVLAE